MSWGAVSVASMAPTPVRTGPRVVLVVGGTSGIGLGTARQLVERGDTVVVASRDAGRVAEVAADLGGGTSGAALDLTDASSVHAAVERCVTDHGRLDAVVTSAQTMAYGTVEQVPADVFGSVVDTAVIGTVHLAQAVLPVFRRQGGGQLVVVSSLLAEISVPSMTTYCAAKWGQLGLVRGLQLETRRDQGVGVSLVLPGAVDTPIYHLAATYAGSAGSAPPPVVAPERVAAACVRAIDRPRRVTHVGPANLLAVTGFRFMPAVYDRLVNPMVRAVAVRGPRVADHDGNVRAARPDGEGLRGGWTPAGRLRDRGGRARWRRRS